MIEPFAQVDFDVPDMVTEYPPRFQHPHKQKVFAGAAALATGTITVRRWRGKLPPMLELSGRPRFDVQEDVFSYPDDEQGSVGWHLNFADSELFGYYGGQLLAQDEHQVLEHPILGSVREAMLDLRHSQPDLAPRTREIGPTPVTVRGAPRSLAFDTQNGLYGNAFARAPFERVLEAVKYLRPPTISNILAIEAPRYGHGEYSLDDIEDVLETAFTGFSACKLESGASQTVIHTGNWGCGAYGGNPTLMAVLQLAAAWLAGIERLIYHSVSAPFTQCFNDALVLMDQLLKGPAVDTRRLMGAVQARKFMWGTGDGN